MASSVYPALGLYWFANVDPTAGAGVSGPLNQLLIRTDTPEIYYKSGAADTAWTSLSGSGVPLPTIVALIAAAIGDIPQMGSTFLVWDDFGFGSWTAVVNTVGGASLLSTVTMGDSSPGVYTSTVTATGDATRLQSGTNATNTLYFGGGEVVWDNIHNIPVLSNGVNNLVLRIGMGDTGTASDNTDGFYLEYDFATYADHNYRLCAASNANRTKVDTGIVAVAGANRHVRLTMNAAGTSGTCTIDGVAGAGAVTSNIPVGSARAFRCCNIQAAKQLGAGAMSVLHDMWRIRQVFTTPRYA